MSVEAGLKQAAEAAPQVSEFDSKAQANSNPAENANLSKKQLKKLKRK